MLPMKGYSPFQKKRFALSSIRHLSLLQVAFAERPICIGVSISLPTLSNDKCAPNQNLESHFLVLCDCNTLERGCRLGLLL